MLETATNRSSAAPLLIAAVAIVAMVAGGIAVATLATGGPATPTMVAQPTERSPSRPPIVAPVPVGTTYRDFIYETETITAPMASKAQSKLWFAHDRWWAGLYQPASERLTIFRLDWVTQRWVDTGVMVDERPNADPDFLWTGDHLYVVTTGPRPTARDAGRVLRYSFDAADDRFELDPNFPITIIDSGTPAAVIAVDTADTVWVAYSAAGRIWVAHSLDHDANWAVPFELPVEHTLVDTEDIASIVAFGPGRIGVMWSNQVTDSVYFSWHQDGDPPDAWSEPEVVIDGLGSSDAHINLKAYPTATGIGVAAALKTSLDTVTPVNQLAPQILLAVRGDAETWTSHLVSQIRDKHTRAIVMVDEAARQFYVAATSPTRGGMIHYKRASIDDPRFETGVGEVLMGSVEDPRLNDATTTKEGLTPASGLLVLAADGETGRYVHAVVDLGGGPPPADPAEPGRTDVPAPPDPPGPITLIRNDFEPWAVGPAAGRDWAVRDGDQADAVSIVDDGAAGRALRVVNGEGRSTRVCRNVAEIPGARLVIEARVRLSALGASDTPIILLRGSGGEVGGVRFRADGDIAWFDAEVKGRTTASIAADQWYRVRLTVDQPTKTYGFTVSTDSGQEIVARTGLAWRASAVPFVRTVCFETADGQVDQRLDVADIAVVARPPR